MLTATVFLPISAPSPLALYASVIAVACLLVIVHADTIRRWHQDIHPIAIHITAALVIVLVLATVTAGAVWLPACTPDDGSWYCWLSRWGLL